MLRKQGIMLKDIIHYYQILKKKLVNLYKETEEIEELF